MEEAQCERADLYSATLKTLALWVAELRRSTRLAFHQNQGVMPKHGENVWNDLCTLKQMIWLYVGYSKSF